MPDNGSQADCTRAPDTIVKHASALNEKMIPPKKISDVRPIFPANELRKKPGSTAVVFEAELSEHGTLFNLRHVSPSDAPGDFIASAQSAVALWRFEPGSIGGCRIPVRTTVQVNYTLQ